MSGVRRRNPEELVIPYAGWELVLPSSAQDDRYVAAGFHEDGVSHPRAVSGDSQSIKSYVSYMDGGWVLFEKFDDMEYEVVDGSEDVVSYGG